jgi:hypothetical protein
MNLKDLIDTEFGREHITFEVVGRTWYDSDSDALTNVPPNIVLGDN